MRAVAELNTGPPGPKKRRPGDKPGQRKNVDSEPTTDIYPSGSQLSSALSADKLSKVSRKEGHVARQ
jgi:hypothetical protein